MFGNFQNSMSIHVIPVENKYNVHGCYSKYSSHNINSATRIHNCHVLFRPFLSFPFNSLLLPSEYAFLTVYSPLTKYTKKVIHKINNFLANNNNKP